MFIKEGEQCAEIRDLIMSYDLNHYGRPEYEYLSRWACGCDGRASCECCEGTGYMEEWLRLDDILKFRPVTIVGYRLAGVPIPPRLLLEPSER